MGAAGTNIEGLFTALSHPIRRQILREMIARRTELSPSELADMLDHSLGKLSYHFGILVECGAIELVRTRPARGSTQHFYRPAIEAEWARKALRTTAPASNRRSGGKRSPNRRLM
jgi:DNA-binding transcriptional ArsR family regulator